jgi:thiol:disulfide interchange protein DsbC
MSNLGGKMKKILVTLLAAFILTPHVSVAAEVQNTQFTQEGGKRIATYDLVGDADEQKAEVTVVITVDGQARAAKDLKVNGDVGKNIKVGPDKRIVWDAAADLPKEFDDKVIWEVKAISAAEAAIAELASMGIDPANAIVIGSGPNYVIEFMDPDCPYSRKAFNYLENRNDLRRYVFLSCKVHPDACPVVSYILTASDRTDAYQKALSGKLDGLAMSIPSAEGDSLREEHQKIADENKVKGYPTLIVNGTRIPGWSRDAVEKALGQR